MSTGAINQSSGYERQKYIAAVTVLQSQDPDGAVQLIPPDSSTAMEALVENPASRSGSRETSPRSPSNSKLASPKRNKSVELMNNSAPNDALYASPRTEEGNTHAGFSEDSDVPVYASPSREVKLKSTPSSGSEGSKREVKLKSTPSSGSEGGSRRSDGEERRKKGSSG